MQIPASRGTLYTLLSAVVILGLTVVAIYYGQGGFRFSRQGVQTAVGLLAANSTPTGASVYIDGKLTTATNDTLDLSPGQYQIELSKDGFSDWRKTLTVEEGLVAQTNALLFPSAPSLTPLTTTGATALLPSPDGQKILFYTAGNLQVKKNGLYILDLTSNTLTFSRGARQIGLDSAVIDLETAKYVWSPDNSQILLIAPEKEVLLDAGTLNNVDTAPDVSARSPQLLTDWQSELAARDLQFLLRFPPEVVEIATTSAKNVYVSPDKKLLLYTATASAVLADDLLPPLPASNTQAQERTLVPDTVYVYDREEDTNFAVTRFNSDVLTASVSSKLVVLPSPALSASDSAGLKKVPSPTPTQTSLQLADQITLLYSPLHTGSPQWYPDSRHIIMARDGQIMIVEYDGTNQTPIYSGPFSQNFFFPWPDGSRLLITTSFSQTGLANLYAIELK